MLKTNTLCIICSMAYQSPLDKESGTADLAVATCNHSGALRTVLVCDVVDSVHWMQRNEAAAIAQWQTFLEAVKHQVIPKLGGRLVKSLGDGLMLEFLVAPQDALSAAFAMKEIAADIRRADTSKQDNFWLRMALHHTTATVGDDDIYGHGVNLCARIATLAGPGEIVISTEMRDQLTDQLDAIVEDMGECFLKHIAEPQRVFRIGVTDNLRTPSNFPAIAEYDVHWDIAVAVMPFDDISAESKFSPIGNVMADAVITHLSKSAAFRVVSRLSSVAVSGRQFSSQDIQKLLGVRYLVSGNYMCSGDQLIVMVELSDGRDGSVVWAEQLRYPLADLLDPHGALIGEIVYGVHSNIIRTEFKHSVSRPLPTVESYTLLLGSITMMHRMSHKDFSQARIMLEHLIERHPRNPSPRAWMAKWHSLAIAQHWTLDAHVEAKLGQVWISSALDIDPSNALALTIKGLLHGYVAKEFDLAAECYSAALRSNPSEPLAWIGTATVDAWKGEGAKAVLAAERALGLSPLDPMRYYFESLSSLAMLSARKYDKAIELATKSMFVNAGLTSTRKVLAIAQVLNGEVEKAKLTIQNLLKAEPGFSIDVFSRTSPAFKSPMGTEYVAAFLQAGVPEK
jgi:adenylate cyclase